MTDRQGEDLNHKATPFHSSSSSLAPSPASFAVLPFLRSIYQSCQCSICYNVFEEPFLLPCSHVFCRACITRSMEANRPNCPLCNRPLKSLRQLTPMPQLAMLTSVARSALVRVSHSPMIRHDPDNNNNNNNNNSNNRTQADSAKRDRVDMEQPPLVSLACGGTSVETAASLISYSSATFHHLADLTTPAASTTTEHESVATAVLPPSSPSRSTRHGASAGLLSERGKHESTTGRSYLEEDSLEDRHAGEEPDYSNGSHQVTYTSKINSLSHDKADEDLEPTPVRPRTETAALFYTDHTHSCLKNSVAPSDAARPPPSHHHHHELLSLLGRIGDDDRESTPQLPIRWDRRDSTSQNDIKEPKAEHEDDDSDKGQQEGTNEDDPLLRLYWRVTPLEPQAPPQASVAETKEEEEEESRDEAPNCPYSPNGKGERQRRIIRVRFIPPALLSLPGLSYSSSFYDGRDEMGSRSSCCGKKRSASMEGTPATQAAAASTTTRTALSLLSSSSSSAWGGRCVLCGLHLYDRGSVRSYLRRLLSRRRVTGCTKRDLQSIDAAALGSMLGPVWGIEMQQQHSKRDEEEEREGDAGVEWDLSPVRVRVRLPAHQNCLVWAGWLPFLFYSSGEGEAGLSPARPQASPASCSLRGQLEWQHLLRLAFNASRTTTPKDKDPEVEANANTLDGVTVCHRRPSWEAECGGGGAAHRFPDVAGVALKDGGIVVVDEENDDGVDASLIRPASSGASLHLSLQRLCREVWTRVDALHHHNNSNKKSSKGQRVVNEEEEEKEWIKAMRGPTMTETHRSATKAAAEPRTDAALPSACCYLCGEGSGEAVGRLREEEEERNGLDIEEPRALLFQSLDPPLPTRASEPAPPGGRRTNTMPSVKTKLTPFHSAAGLRFCCGSPEAVERKDTEAPQKQQHLPSCTRAFHFPCALLAGSGACLVFGLEEAEAARRRVAIITSTGTTVLSQRPPRPPREEDLPCEERTQQTNLGTTTATTTTITPSACMVVQPALVENSMTKSLSVDPTEVWCGRCRRARC